MTDKFPPPEDVKTLWFAAKMRFGILIEQTGLTEYEDRVYLFPHSTLDGLLEQAKRIGKSQEQEYINADGNRVRDRLVQILKLDVVYLDAGDLNEIEVYSERISAEVGSRTFDWQPDDDSICHMLKVP